MHQVSGSISLPSRGSFRLSLTVLVHYRSMMSPHIQTGFHVSRPTFRTLSTTVEISNTGLSPTMVKLPSLFFYLDSYYVQAPPRSLATTCGISVDFFSSGYLDGSVLRVRFSKSMYST